MIITERKIDKKILEDNGQFRQLFVTMTEFSSLIKCTKEIRYKYTIKRIVDTETIWLLSSAKDNILSITSGGVSFIPIWSSNEYGNDFCKKVGNEYHCKAVSLYDFLDYLQEYNSEKDLKIGIFPTSYDIMGFIVSIESFIQGVDKEQEWY
ncbi:MAG: DUF2750 domain-containing protein [Muribaculaceae bacterium]|nr:DUF2750 domain-containing protein [Muribaculaceae bacterium]